MSKFKNKYRVESTRLPSWDYTWGWWYYVTFNVNNHNCVFGDVIHDHVEFSMLGKTADSFWKQIPDHQQGVELDEYIVMPNHIHGIIILPGVESPRDVRKNVSPQDNVSQQGNISEENNIINEPSRREFFRNISPKKGSLGLVIRQYKAAVTGWARDHGFVGFQWQERFYDHIIRDGNDLQRIRDYIRNNPLRWSLDKMNPNKQKKTRCCLFLQSNLNFDS